MLALMYSRLSIHQLCFSGQIYGGGENKYGGRGGLDGTNNCMSRLVRIIISIRRNDYTIINKKGADVSLLLSVNVWHLSHE